MSTTTRSGRRGSKRTRDYAAALGNAVLRLEDRLRSDVDDRRLYEQTKRELAARDWSNMNDYATAKTEVIETILLKCRKQSS